MAASRLWASATVKMTHTLTPQLAKKTPLVFRFYHVPWTEPWIPFYRDCNVRKYNFLWQFAHWQRTSLQELSAVKSNYLRKHNRNQMTDGQIKKKGREGENRAKGIERWRDRERIVLAIFPEWRDRSAERVSLTISSVGRMSQANNGKQSSSLLALSLSLFPLPSFHFSGKTIIAPSEGRRILPPWADIWKTNPFSRRSGRQAAVSLLKHWLTTSGGSQHTHTHTSSAPHEAVKIPQCIPALHQKQ